METNALGCVPPPRPRGGTLAGAALAGWLMLASGGGAGAAPAATQPAGVPGGGEASFPSFFDEEVARFRRLAACGIPEYLVEAAQGFRHLQFIPCAEVGPHGTLAPWAVRPEAYGRFLCQVFDEWTESGYPEVSIRTFDHMLA